MPKFKIYLDRAYEWRWRFLAGNGEIMAVSEGYVTKAGAIRSATRMKVLVPTARIEQ